MIPRFLIGICAAGLLSGAEFTTYIGDPNVDLEDYKVVRVLADSAGNTYVAGNRQNVALFESASAEYPFVMKLDPGGNIVMFVSLDERGASEAHDLAIDTAGNIYIGGSTSSTLFPVHNGLALARWQRFCG